LSFQSGCELFRPLLCWSSQNQKLGLLWMV